MKVLKGASLELHELREEHLTMLFRWRNSGDFMELCSTRRNCVSLDEFCVELRTDLKRDRHVQFLIVKNEELIGTIYSYNLNRTDGHAFVTTFVAESWRRKGYGAKAVVIFLEYLFREFDLHKVYVEVYSYNLESLRALISGGFVEEGRFREHRLYGGKRHDLIRLAFFRSQMKDSSRLVERLTNQVLFPI